MKLDEWLTRLVAVPPGRNPLANGIAVITFLMAGAVYWRECLLMIFLATAGGYIGAAYSRKMDPRILRGFVIATGTALSAYYFYR